MDKPVMTLQGALDILSAQGWFSERSLETRDRLAAIAKLRNFATNDLIYMEGDRPNGMFGLVSGSLNVSFPRGDGEDYTVHRATTGFWIGDLALFSGDRRLVSVCADEPATMVHFPDPDLRRLVKQYPALYADFYRLSYENSRTMLRIICNLAIPSSEKRLADRLLMELDTRSDVDGWIPVPQAELAALAAMSLPTLQRVLRRFQGAGVIDKSYARIRVIDRDALTRICRDDGKA